MKNHRSAINQTIIARFEQVVEMFPQNLAVVTSSHSVSYEALSHRVNEIVSSIPGPPLQTVMGFSTCCLLFSHNHSMIEGILSALKAGYAYVPVDPAYPFNRLRSILIDSAASIIFTDSSNRPLAERLSAATPTKVIVVDDLASKNNYQPFPLPAPPPTSPAYILYTSGSTGIPKGVIQSHKNALHFNQVYTESLRINPADRLSMFSKFCFDAAIMDVLGALMNGAALYPFDMYASDGFGIDEFIKNNKITIYHSVPTLFRRLIGQLSEKEILETVRLVVLGGEPVCPTDVSAYKSHFPEHCRFINGLGPTESTVTLQYVADKNTDVDLISRYVPVGYPVSHTDVIVIDTNGVPVSDGTLGELVYKSDYLALGYLNDPEKTARSFTVDPRTQSGRVYRSGDLGRRWPDGCFEFVGRSDTQIKINGVRIELGEIESILRRISGVIECAVVLVNGGDSPSLAACLLFDLQSDRTNDEDIVTFIIDYLPLHSLPAHFLRMQSLPKTDSGKIDRLKLAENVDTIIKERLENFSHNSCPEGAMEEVMVRVFRSILRCDLVGVCDDFFALGGDSLDVFRAVVELQQSHEIFVTPEDVYRHRTVRQLAKIAEHLTVGRGARGQRSNPLVLMRKGTRGRGCLFAVHAGAGEIASYRQFAEVLQADVTCWGISTSHKTIAPRNAPISDVAAQYLNGIEEECRGGPTVILGWCFGATRAFEIAAQMERKGLQPTALILVNAMPPTRTVDNRNAMVRDYSLLDPEVSRRDDERFSVESEITLIRRLLGSQYDDLIRNHSPQDINRLWAWFISRLNHEGEDVRTSVTRNLINLLPEDRKRAIPRFRDDMELEELLRYVNVLRSDADAQALYTPSQHTYNLSADMLFISAKDEPASMQKDWAKFFSGSAVFADTPGDHFSIWEEGRVELLAKIVDDFLKDRL